MDMDKTYFDMATLVGKFLADDLTGEERRRLNEWLAVSERNREWFQRVTSEGYRSEKGEKVHSVDVNKGWQALQAKRLKKREQRLWIRWSKYAAIFVLPLFVAGIAYWLMQENESSIPEVQLIAAGKSKAFLVMNDGTSVPIDQWQKKVLEEMDGTKINLQEEHITYENAIPASGEELIYNELVVPRGGEFSLTLSDGTVVYLNADSKLRYPVKFGKANRVVELEGEGYFQVTRDESSPFVVKTSRLDVRVLGTEFNVSAYAEDTVIQTTLVNGSVKVAVDKYGESVVLRPGEQAELGCIGNVLRVNVADVSYATAWKNGRLRFQEKPLYEIMKTVARWYDVEVVYEDEEVKDYPFGCNFSRHSTIEPLLEVFEATGTITTRVEGRKIRIKKRK